MRLALQTDYALRTLIYLALQDERSTIGEVAKFYDISAAHVAKVVNQLAKRGWIRSLRGIGGGIELVAHPEQISIGEVVHAFEGNLHLLECVGTENVCVIQPFCSLKTVLAEAERIQTDYLNSVMLKDVLPERRQMVDLKMD